MIFSGTKLTQQFHKFQKLMKLCSSKDVGVIIDPSTSFEKDASQIVKVTQENKDLSLGTLNI